MSFCRRPLSSVMCLTCQFHGSSHKILLALRDKLIVQSGRIGLSRESLYLFRQVYQQHMCRLVLLVLHVVLLGFLLALALSDQGLSSVFLELLQILIGNNFGRRAVGSDIVNAMGFESHVYHHT